MMIATNIFLAMELDPEIAQDLGKDTICLEEDEDRTVEKENTEITENKVTSLVIREMLKHFLELEVVIC